jgi:type I restriction enzyme S subunit
MNQASLRRPPVLSRYSWRFSQSTDLEPLDLELPELPNTYVLGTLGAAAEVLEYGTSKKAGSDERDVPVLRMGNIQSGSLVLDDLKYCRVDREIERLMLQDGDLLFNRTNSPELVGKAAVFHESRPMTFASYLIRLRFASDTADPDFVNYWINSAWGRAWARYVKADGVSQSNINGTKLGSMPLPLPPVEEQREIVRRASQLLASANALLARMTRRVETSTAALSPF